MSGRKIRCRNCNKEFSGFFDKFITKKRKCCECQKYFCTNCTTFNRCKNCFIISSNINATDAYSSLTKIPISGLKRYVIDVVGQYDIRALREKTDFVDKIFQFKGIKSSKEGYLSNIHRRSTPPQFNSFPNVNSTNLNFDVQSSSSVSLNPENLINSSPIIREGSQSITKTSSRSSISLDSANNIEMDSPLTKSNPNLESQPITINLTSSSQSKSLSNSPTQTSLFERERQLHSSGHTPVHDINEIHDDELTKIKNYSVKELKNYLNAEHVNFMGVVEKKELYNKAKNLLLDKRNNKKILEQQKKEDEEFESLPKSRDNDKSVNSATNPYRHFGAADVEKDICKICWDATINCVLLECGHMCSCINCSKKLTECPICREHVVRCVHVFRV